MNIQIRKDKLLEILKKNKELHVAEFKEARKIYNSELIDELVIASNKIKDNGEVDLYSFSRKPKPKNYAASYDTAIKMLQWHDQDTVELDARHYNAYVEDEWDWTNDFKTTSSSYSNPKGL